MTEKQQLGIELLKELASVDYKAPLRDNPYAVAFQEGVNSVHYQVKRILEATDLL